MIFYHLSTNLFHNNKFYPRIPRSRSNGEDDNIERISVSTTIGGCLSAIPNGDSDLGSFLMELIEYRQNGIDFYNIPKEEIPHFKLYKINTDKYNHITEKNIIKPKILYKKDYVIDAYWTEEHWITKKLVVKDEDISYIKIKNWHEEAQDLIPPDIFYKAIESDGNYIDLYFKKHEDKNKIPVMTLIKHVEYEEIDF